MTWCWVFSLPKDGADSVRECFIKFALSFIVVGEVDVITRVLEVQGEKRSHFLAMFWSHQFATFCVLCRFPGLSVSWIV